MAATWSRPPCAWWTQTSAMRQCTRVGAKLCGPNPSRHFTNSIACITSERFRRSRINNADLPLISIVRAPDRVDALVWAFTELLVEEIASWGIYETTRRKAEAVIKARLAAAEAGRPKSEPAPGSQEYQALHPEWQPQDGGESY